MAKSASNDNVFMKIVKYLIPWKGDRVGEIIRKIVFLTALVVLITTVVIYLTVALENRRNRQNDEILLKAVTNPSSGTGVQIPGSEDGNNDTELKLLSMWSQFFTEEGVTNGSHRVDENEIRGWLTINGYGSEEPLVNTIVMQKMNDNDYYLEHNYFGEWAKAGSLYVDGRCIIEDGKNPGNIVIYGHNMSMLPGVTDYFGGLLNYFNYARENYGDDGRLTQDDINDPDSPIHNIDFYKKHPTIKYSSLYEESTYKIFGGVMLNTNSSDTEIFNYHRVYSFADKEEFDDYCAEILDRSCFINPDVDLRYGDELMTLSTCIYSYNAPETRFVIFARKTRADESPEVDVEKAYANPSPKFYRSFYSYFRYDWEGRKWPTDIIWGLGQ